MYIFDVGERTSQETTISESFVPLLSFLSFFPRDSNAGQNRWRNPRISYSPLTNTGRRGWKRRDRESRHAHDRHPVNLVTSICGIRVHIVFDIIMIFMNFYEELVIEVNFATISFEFKVQSKIRSIIAEMCNMIRNLYLKSSIFVILSFNFYKI